MNGIRSTSLGIFPPFYLLSFLSLFFYFSEDKGKENVNNNEALQLGYCL